MPNKTFDHFNHGQLSKCRIRYRLNINQHKFFAMSENYDFKYVHDYNDAILEDRESFSVTNVTHWALVKMLLIY